MRCIAPMKAPWPPPTIPARSRREACPVPAPLTVNPLGQLANAHVADGERPRVIALDADQAAGGHAVVRVGGEFAGRDLVLPVSALQLVVDDLVAVEPVLDMVAVQDDARFVPVVVRVRHAGRHTVEGEGGPGSREGALAVLGVGIIEQLIFGRTPVDVVVLARASIEDTAVARLADLPLELELEIAVRPARHQVIHLAVLVEHTSLDVPAIWQTALGRVLPPAAPVGSTVILEQRVPAAGARARGVGRAGRGRCTAEQQQRGVDMNPAHVPRGAEARWSCAGSARSSTAGVESAAASRDGAANAG